MKRQSNNTRTLRQYLLLLFTLMLVITSITQCRKKPFVNPLDPNDPDYEKPRLIYLSLIDSTVLTTDTLSITWESNFPALCEYAYRYSATTPWSNWVLDTTLFDLIADGDYHFEIATRYQGMSDTTIAAARFTIHSLDQSAVFCAPRTQTVSNAMPLATITLQGKYLDTCTAIEIKVKPVLIKSARLADGTATGSFVFAKDSIVTLGIGPNDSPIQGTMPLVTMEVYPLGPQDTTECFITVLCAKRVNDTVSDTISVNQVKGCFIIRK